MLNSPDAEIPSTKALKVVICDVHPQMRSGLRHVLATMLGCDVVGETSTGEGALALVEKHAPTMIVLDLFLAGAMNGRTVLHEIRRKKLPVKVFVHTESLRQDDFEEWFKDPDGPDGVDEKVTGDIELSIAFTQVLVTSQKHMPMRLVKKFMHFTGAHTKTLTNLTAKEFQVLKLAVQPNISITDIAKHLQYSASTVRCYLATIYSKLGLEQHNRAALIGFYLTHQHNKAS